MKSVAAVLTALLFLPLLSASSFTTRARYLMGTVCSVEVGKSPRAEEDIAAAFAEAERIESFLSTWRADSELSRLNRGETANVSSELSSLLERVGTWRDRTRGAFEPRIRPLVDLWGIRQEGTLPDRLAIDMALTAIRSGAAAIEEGAFGKGYALDRMLGSMQARHVVINFGGQLAVRGAARVTIANPRDRTAPVVAFTLRDGSLSTSSGSEKTFEAAGRTFSHLLDPRSGQALPARGSVSVIAPDALTADILSTALYVMGEADGMHWADENSVAATFITDSNQIRRSVEMRRRIRDFTLLDRNLTLKD